MTYVALALALVIGVVLGMLGGGGAVLMVPMLVYVARMEVKSAIATSLFVIGVTSAFSAGLHARRGAVRWKIGGVLGGAAMAGAFAGGRLAHYVSGRALLLGFAMMMLATSVAMLRDRKASTSEATPQAFQPSRAVAIGLGVGLVSGMVGAGGGFLIVPALTIFAGLAMRDAIGTSLFVITLQSAAGFAGHVSDAALDWPLVIAAAAITAVGSVAGVLAGRRSSPVALRRVFGGLVLLVALATFGMEISAGAAIASGVAVAVALVLLRTRTPGRPCTTSLRSHR